MSHDYRGRGRVKVSVAQHSCFLSAPADISRMTRNGESIATVQRNSQNAALFQDAIALELSSELSHVGTRCFCATWLLKSLMDCHQNTSPGYDTGNNAKYIM